MTFTFRFRSSDPTTTPHPLAIKLEKADNAGMTTDKMRRAVWSTGLISGVALVLLVVSLATPVIEIQRWGLLILAPVVVFSAIAWGVLGISYLVTKDHASSSR